MKRRSFLRLLVSGALTASIAGTAFAHTPYRQWTVLRQRFLLVHSSRTDPVSDVIADQIVVILDRVLPQANAMVARGPDDQRIASLITTGQAMLAVMRADHASDLFRGQGGFQDYQGEMLRALVSIDGHVLVTTDTFPRTHAWLVTSALVENGAELGVRTVTDASGSGGVLPHEGALAFARGEPLEVAQ
jgi:hypothetical protein